jgi:hypothetical protein
LCSYNWLCRVASCTLSDWNTTKAISCAKKATCRIWKLSLGFQIHQWKLLWDSTLPTRRYSLPPQKVSSLFAKIYIWRPLILDLSRMGVCRLPYRSIFTYQEVQAGSIF